MTTQRTLKFEFDPTTQLSDKVPHITVHGDTLVRIRRGQNQHVDLGSNSRPQTLKILRAFREVLIDTIEAFEIEDRKEKALEQNP